MENLESIRNLHEKVQNDIFKILLQYNVVDHLSSTRDSRVAMYFISDDYKFLFYELPSEVSSFLSSINRLLETNFIKLVIDPFTDQLFFVRTKEMRNFKEAEKKHYIVLSGKSLNEYLDKRSKLNFVGEIR
jgi:hypothetical protein